MAIVGAKAILGEHDQSGTLVVHTKQRHGPH